MWLFDSASRELELSMTTVAPHTRTVKNFLTKVRKAGVSVPLRVIAPIMPRNAIAQLLSRSAALVWTRAMCSFPF